MSIIIRKAGVADLPAVYELIKEFAVFQKTPGKLLISAEQMVKDKDIFCCFVAVDESGTIAGFASFYFTYFSWSGKGMYLDDLYVKENFRKQQLGKRLLQAVIDFAKKENCKKLRWQVSGWNSNAIEFYKKVGAVIDDTEINCDLNL
ncbi:MAG: GNAT family N-acetyltransferase [Ferruginibacter sp.]